MKQKDYKKLVFLILKKIILFLFIILLFSCKKNKLKNNNDIKIVSLTPSITRILFHLGVGNDVVGVTDYCDVSSDLFYSLIREKKIERLGGFNSPNIEKIIYTNPTMLFGMDSFSYETKTRIDLLFGKKVVWFRHPKNYQEIANQIKEIATIVGKKDIGRNLINMMNEKVDKISKKIDIIENKKKVLVEIYQTPFTTCGKNTFISSIVTNSGGVLAFESDENWPTPTIESIIVTNFDIILKTHINDGKIPNFYKNKPIFIPRDISFYLQPGIETDYAIEELHQFLYEK